MEAYVAGEDRSRPFSKYPPPGVDARLPNIARVYDAFLGGKDNFAADRQVVESVLRVSEDAPAVARANRAFLRRVVRYLTGEAGMTQLLDIGSGLPTAGNVHEVAHELNPEVRTVYVDNDPVVHIHGQALLADRLTTEVVTADVRRPAEIVGHPEIRGFLDFSEPVGLLLMASCTTWTTRRRRTPSWPRCGEPCPAAAIWPSPASPGPGRSTRRSRGWPGRWNAFIAISSVPGTGARPTRSGAGSATGRWWSRAWSRSRS